MPDLTHIAEPLRPLAVPVDTLVLDPANVRRHCNVERSWYNGTMPYTKTVQCVDCGQSREIRKDSKASRCFRCARIAASKPGQPRPDRIRGAWHCCAKCGEQFWKRPSEGDRRFCSSECGNSARRRDDISERRRARWTVNNAVRDGRMVRLQSCEECGGPSPEMHHDDYSKPLEVRWLCHPCHTSLHVSRGDLKAHA